MDSNCSMFSLKNFFNCSELLYMAPELLRTYLAQRRAEVSQAGDIYAVGIIMHEILYRMEPYSDSDQSAEGK